MTEGYYLFSIDALQGGTVNNGRPRPVNELTGPGHLEAADRSPRHPVEVIQAVELVADKDPVDGRGVLVHDAGDPGRSEAPVLTEGDHPPFDRPPRFRRAAMGPRRAVLEAGEAFVLVAVPPHVGPVPRYPHGGGGMGHRPAALDPLAQQQSTLGSQASITVHSSPPW